MGLLDFVYTCRTCSDARSPAHDHRARQGPPVAGDHAYQLMDREVQRSTTAWEIGLIPLLLWVMANDLRRMWPRHRDRWKRIHVPFSIVLLVTMLAHIAIALHLM